VHSLLEKREVTTYEAVLYTGSVVIVTAANYPAIGRLFTVANKNQILKQAFRLIPGYCLGPSVQSIAITIGTAGILNGLQAEHPIDVSIVPEVITRLLTTVCSDKSWRRLSNLPHLARFAGEGK
jgi:hypothetical protein